MRGENGDVLITIIGIIIENMYTIPLKKPVLNTPKIICIKFIRIPVASIPRIIR